MSRICRHTTRAEALTAKAKMTATSETGVRAAGGTRASSTPVTTLAPTSDRNSAASAPNANSTQGIRPRDSPVTSATRGAM